MSSYPPPDAAIQTVGIFQYCKNANGQRFKRKRGTEQWEPSQPESLSDHGQPPPPLTLSLVLESQAPGEPNHWYLLVAREDEEPGMVYQVTGDAECMAYEPSSQPDPITASETFLNMYELATLTDETAAVVRKVAEQEPPPQAESRRDVTENCQGWDVRVLAKLADRDIVTEGKVEFARSMVEPV